MLIAFLFSSGCAVKQPPYMVVEKEKSKTLTCSQLKATSIYKYWYKQRKENDTRLQLMVYSTQEGANDVEQEFRQHFSSTRTKDEVSLQLKSARPEDEGTYFCAEQEHTVRQPLRKQITNLFREKQAHHITSFTGCAVKQPPYMVVGKGKSKNLTCSQLKTTYTYMAWYKQGREGNSQLQMVIWSTEGTHSKVEKEFESRFSNTGTQNYALSLQLKNAQLEDSGTYFCAKQDYTVRQLLRKPNTNLFTGKCKRIREQILHR
ncbi:hypothetical protein lerEdw1_009033 [Lerista edwardsae]|nr:hypothetical protein lerEdw1_009033 [Lerista edwardsae]